jgi:hypothetical protein
MALSSSLIANNIYTQFSARQITGRNARDLANAVGMATYMFITTPNIVSCTLTGTVGPVGTITSIVTLGIVPVSMSNLMKDQATAKKLTGRSISTIFSAAATGLTISLTSLTLTGTSAGLAVGIGTGSFSYAVNKTMANILASQEVTKYLRGRNNIDLANCIAFGFVNHIKQSAKITVTATGAIAPVAPAGPVATANVPSVFTKIS